MSPGHCAQSTEGALSSAEPWLRIKFLRSRVRKAMEITDLAAARWRERMLTSDVCSSNQIKIYSSPGFSDDSFACFSSSREYNVPFLLECLQTRAPGECRTTWLLGSSNMDAGFLLPAPSYVVCPVHVQSRSWSQSHSLFMFFFFFNYG